MSISTIKGTLSAEVADDGTFTVDYPSGKDAGHFGLGVGHKIILTGYGTFDFPSGVFLTFGTSNITVKNKSGNAWAADTDYRIQLEEIGDRVFRVGEQSYDRNKAATLPVSNPSLALNAWKGGLTIVSLGAPDTADADGILDGVTATDSAQSYDTDDFILSELDVPRNITMVASAGADHVVTVTGKDAYGNTMVEEITLNADTPVAGKKAFKSLTTIVVAAGASGDTVDVGFGDVLGLPVFLPATGLILAELEDGSAPTAGTAVAGVQTEGGATATDGDVRGTYDPNSAADGSKEFHLVLALPDPSYIGLDQYAG